MNVRQSLGASASSGVVCLIRSGAGKWAAPVALGVVFAGWSAAAQAQAQSTDLVFPQGNAGYDQQLGVTVRTRNRSLYDTPGIQLGTFSIRPSLDQSILYNSNPLGSSGSGNSGSGSFVSNTAASVSAASLWARDSLGASVTVSHLHYFSLPIDYTDFSGGLVGGYTIDGDQLLAAYSHQSNHTLGTTIATTRSSTPMLDQTDTARLSYTLRAYQVSITPELSASAYRFGNATVLGVPISQKFLDRNVFAGGITTRLPTAGETTVVVVARGVDSQFTTRQPGLPSNNSLSGQLLAGLDYQPNGPIRYQLLIGGEIRSFAAHQYATRTSPILAGNIIWTPTGLLTVTGVVSRTIDDPQSGGTNGYVLTSGSLRGDYELQRNILLEAHGQLQSAEFLQGGSQTNVSAGGTATWLVSPRARLAVSYEHTRQSGSSTLTPAVGNLGSVGSGQFTQSVAGLTLHLGL